MEAVERYKSELSGSTKTAKERSKFAYTLSQEAQDAHKRGDYEASCDKFAYLRSSGAHRAAHAGCGRLGGRPAG